MTDYQTACAVLGVDEQTSIDEVKTTARKLLFRFHPDMNPDDPSGAGERTKTILEAYRFLTDHLKPVERPEPVQEKPVATYAEPFFTFKAQGNMVSIPVSKVKCVLSGKSSNLVTQNNPNNPYYVGYVMHQGKYVSVFDSGVIGIRGGCVEERANSIVLLCNERGLFGVLADEVKGVEMGVPTGLKIAV